MRPLFQALIDEFGSPARGSASRGSRSKVTTRTCCGPRRRADNVYEVATDTFVVRDGKITAQSFTGKIVPKGCIMSGR